MPASCPICEQPIASTAAHCTVCGFPTSLAIEGLRSVDAAAPPGPEGNGAAVARHSVGGAHVGAAPPRALSPEEELNAAISRDLRSKMEVVHDLGRAPDVTSELCQAALLEAEGHAGEALTVLRSAQSRLETETDQLLRQRLRALEGRRAALQTGKVRFALGTDLARLTAAVDGGQREEAVGLLVEAERRVGQFESDWKGLQGLLDQITTLRDQAAELGFPLGEISGELEGIRDRLRGAEVTEDSLDTFAQEAAQTLMLLHEAIPSSLEAELGRTGATLEGYPEDHFESGAARRFHAEASRHLKKGRLSEAIASVRELRREIERLERGTPPVPAARAEAAPAPSSPPTEEEDAMLERLLKKARSLAARVRTLPPESETAHDAAVQIREATELLRARRLREADDTLTRLMRMLAGGPPGA